MWASMWQVLPIWKPEDNSQEPVLNPSWVRRQESVLSESSHWPLPFPSWDRQQYSHCTWVSTEDSGAIFPWSVCHESSLLLLNQCAVLTKAKKPAALIWRRPTFPPPLLYCSHTDSLCISSIDLPGGCGLFHFVCPELFPRLATFSSWADSLDWLSLKATFIFNSFSLFFPLRSHLHRMLFWFPWQPASSHCSVNYMWMQLLCTARRSTPVMRLLLCTWKTRNVLIQQVCFLSL